MNIDLSLNVSPVASSVEWDRHLALLGGHPLQSAFWGNARHACDGIQDERWSFSRDGNVVGLMRCEVRGIGPVKNVVAWVPQGPVFDTLTYIPNLLQPLRTTNNKSRFSALVTCPWETVDCLDVASRRTVWIDLTQGVDVLWKKLDKQWRYGARRAQKKGVSFEATTDDTKIRAFHQLCCQISETKKFSLNCSLDFLCYLLQNKASSDAGIDATLFIASYEGHLCAGALIIRVGQTIHYMWGAVDRMYSRERVGEYIQWNIIEWGCQQGYTLYDLEGIDEKNNPGVAAFKKKMGGTVVGLKGKRVYPMRWSGHLLAPFIRG